MKKNLLLSAAVVLCCIAATANAQEGELSNRHEIRAGVGAVWFPEYGSNHDQYYSPDRGYANWYYKGDLVATPAINLSYTYRLKRWLALGATLTYMGQFQKEYDLYADAVHTTLNQHFFGFTPMLRADWVRTNSVTCYSIAGFGLGVASDKLSYSLSENSRRETLVVPTIDFTLIGVSVGRKFFGFCELGMSNIGIVKAGVGYRFNNKSSK